MLTELRAITAEPPGASIIEHLEYALKIAHTGDLSAITIVAVHRDGSASTTYSKLHSAPAMLGALDLAAHKIRGAL